MINRADIESLNFTWYKQSPKSFTNDIDNRNDYVAAVQQGEILVIILLYVYDNGYVRITNMFANPMKNKFYYFLGEARTKSELQKVLNQLEFKPLKVAVNIIS